MRRVAPGLLLCVAALTLAPAGCVIVSTSRTETDSGPPDAAPAFDAGPPIDAGDVAIGAEATRALLASVGERVIFASIRDFEDAAAELERRTGAYEGSGDAADREAAREAWRVAIAIWQELELMQLGPAGMGGTAAAPGVVGGRDLRDQIDSWPLTNQCRIDQETVSGDYQDRAAFAIEAVNVRGLDALEYLLFATGTDNGCAPSATINASGAWGAMVAAGTLDSRRAEYAHTLAELVHERAVELETAWDPVGEDWLGQLARGGTSGSAYPTAQEALNAISDALFYLDKELKDMKIAAPIDPMDCTSGCADRLESRWAGVSRDHMLANLRGAQRIYLGDRPGTEAPGFDDLLVAVGAGDVAGRMSSAFEAAIAAADATPALDASTLAASVDELMALHAAVKAITDLLKSELVTVLDLELPQRAQGDND